MNKSSYSTIARLFHWGMAVFILATIPVGIAMVQEGLDRSVQNALFIFHKNIGVLIFLLVIARLGYRLRHPPAPLPTGVPSWQVRIAGFNHTALYALLFIMPVTGYTRVKAGGFPIETLDALGVPSLVPRFDALAEVAKTVHFIGGILIALLIAAHIGAAAYHAIARRDGVFSRMWPPVRRRRT